jgi:tryptophan synthase alpha chain
VSGATTAAWSQCGPRLQACFAAARAAGRPAVIPYVTAGDPDLETTRRLVLALGEAGAGPVELGVPFSDPIADGPVIQRAAERALHGGTRLRSVLELAARLRSEGAPPIVLFTYYNPIHRMGDADFVAAATDAGLDGVLVTDLPPEEGGDLGPALAAAGIDLVHLVAPTSGAPRVSMICREGRGFLYVISRTGVTGSRDSLPEGLADDLRRVREAAAGRLPVAVGFGLGRPEHVRSLTGLADGVVVGSALVGLIEERSGHGDVVEAAAGFCRGLIEAGGG